MKAKQTTIQGDALENENDPVHCAILGDGMTGKTCMTLSYSTRQFVDEYTATICDQREVVVHTQGRHYNMCVVDTAGQSDYEYLRCFAYKESDVLLLCFSVCDRESFYNVCNSWVPEVKKHIKGKRPIILVGTQTDLRHGNQETEVTYEEGVSMAKDIGAVTYMECSAKNGSGLDEVFGEVLDKALKRKKRSSSFMRMLSRMANGLR
ncbi:cdc42 homolog [Biomphalaria glabrata]|uniref:Cdc42 homolog n=1 Tax=Biomphalaria glabrata TaxID=6526 RepID=A0A9U8E8Q6_BIOGL|nr:cdc42 homolog [Biomphalaria glabrata]